MASSLQLQFRLPPSTTPALLRHRPIQCATDRQALFDRIAPVYDNLNDLLSLGQHRIWKRMAVSWSGAKAGDCVLDICCGSGDLAFLLSQKVGSNGKVTGLDFSRQQLSIASSRQTSLSRPCYKNIEWVEGDALNLPFSDGSVDAITMGYGLRNVLDKRKALEEMLRVLKEGLLLVVFPGSKLSILDFNKATQPTTAAIQEWMINNIVVPMASGYGLAEDYKYLSKSISEFSTGKELEKLALEMGFMFCLGSKLWNLTIVRIWCFGFMSLMH
ncbi:2-phytyl-1,4-beta-naphthoquinone methyltransferase, chloroplastic isoform X1 [Cucurbita pepo subsp. pepo]|uniref:2-phytyl-1,4-beta-naphthoquinone methyltransferase, chloroplastic isoform X1 n=1 Tax=Cucurbita pepo subsp. pepo TaxID=3664 RepID=UPI000C9D709A|nr:2-phytyl-1,4-beta-naphthoquinone methyltransferase, chloroplastic isoform X1 [Cucurbita pepo subsp. pepo]XP_023545820.1 2-phytyl-1,4-beta-naphthoquinone methyltransferase, chloroplastic isoform X1 [Cucurbita pepo subsp. pepo]XP_023545821.1 2-phytyl-1,4-beta-naphthoquinone methyltransferase, chloroplastic isoform X1 [Cucurbita pepo subsp. pepo]